MSLLEKIAKLCTGDYTRVEVWSNDDIGARAMKPYIRRIKRQLQEYHPELHVLSTYRTPFLKDFQGEFIHGLLYGLFYGYVIKVSSNVDPFALKRSCMELEIDCYGYRMADIDVYPSANLEGSLRKISRKQLGRNRRRPPANA